MVISAHMANEIAEESFEMTAFENFVTEEFRNGDTAVGLYLATKDETRVKYAAWCKVNDRQCDDSDVCRIECDEIQDLNHTRFN